MGNGNYHDTWGVPSWKNWANERNKAFLTPDPAKEMIVTFFTKPIGESETKYMTATKIAGKFAPYLKISPTKVGIAMA